MDDAELFDRVFSKSLGREPELLVETYVRAVERCDLEQERLLDEAIRLATVLGMHAVVARRSRRNG